MNGRWIYEYEPEPWEVARIAWCPLPHTEATPRARRSASHQRRTTRPRALLDAARFALSEGERWAARIYLREARERGVSRRLRKAIYLEISQAPRKDGRGAS